VSVRGCAYVRSEGEFVRELMKVKLLSTVKASHKIILFENIYQNFLKFYYTSRMRTFSL